MLSRMSCSAIITLIITTAMAGCSGSPSMSGGGGGGGNSTTVTFNFTAPMPSAIATQIGSGAFTTATLSNNTVTLSIPEGTTNFAAAFVCPSTTSGTYTINEEFLLIASITDGTTYSEQCYPAPPSPQMGTMTGAVDASAINDSFYIGFLIYEPSNSTVFDDYSEFLSTGQALSFSNPFPTGTNDMLVMAEDASNNPLAMREFPAQTVPGVLNGGNTVTFGAADQTTVENVTFNNVPAGTTPGIYVDFTTASGGEFQLPGLLETAYLAPPAAMLTGTAEFQVSSVATPEPANTPQVFTWTILNAAAPVTFNFPDPWNCTVPTPAALPTFDLGSYTGFAGKSGVFMVASFDWRPSQNVIDEISLTTYPDVVSASGVAIPNLTTVNSSFLTPPVSGDLVPWGQTVLQYGSGKVGDSPVGSTNYQVSCNGNYTVP